TIVGIVLGIVLSWALARTGFVEGVTNPLAYNGDIVYYLHDHKTLFAGAALTIAAAAIFGLGTWYLRYQYPKIVVSSRRRNIDVTLPHAIVFMYALSRGGMDLLEVLRVLADTEDTYGEIANEAETIVREVEFFGNDTNTALRNVRNLTPSDNFEQFLDDMLGVLDSGGDLTVFFENESESYLEEARDEQHSFLETLAVLSEFFVVLFVAAPLFIIVILVVMSLLGGETLVQLGLLVYAILPLSMIGFLVLLDTLSEPYKQPSVHFGENDDDIEHGLALVAAVVRDAIPGLGPRPAAASATSEPLRARQAQYLAHRRRKALVTALSDPLSAFRTTPVYSLTVTVPLAVIVGALAVVFDLASPTWGAMLDAPIPTTTWLMVVPLLVVLIPLSAFHERKRRHERQFADRFPDTLSVLASANKMGIAFDDALRLISRWSTGPLAREMRLLRNDLRWNFDTRAAMRNLADRVAVPQLARTMTLIGEGIRSSTDVAAVLSIAARDTKERFKLDRERRQELTPYIAVVVIGFLVFLLVVVLLDSAYLTPIARAKAETTPPPTEAGQSLPVSLSNTPVAAYKALFLHAAVIQALGSGVLAGKLAENDAFSGLKYSILLLVVAIAAFALL
ncbi:MAG: type II secretion system F family protein, partial [Halapricum sp.]